MRRSFSYTLLITWILLFLACKTNLVITSETSQNIGITEVISPVDSQIIQLYLPYKNIIENDMLRIISYADTEMKRAKPESNLTNFLADLLLNEGIEEAQKEGLDFEPQISYYNYTGIRTSIPKGSITVGNIFELMPFENELVFVEFDGEQVQSLLNSIAATGGDAIGGISFIISDRVAKNVFVNGAKLEMDKNYWIVTNDYIADGNDGMEIFRDKKALVKTGRKIRDVIISYLEKKQNSGENIRAKLDGRIRYE